jgi:hypothetical protein
MAGVGKEGAFGKWGKGQWEALYDVTKEAPPPREQGAGNVIGFTMCYSTAI